MLLELTQSLLFKPVQYVKICSLYMVSVSTTCPALICVSRLVVGCAPNMRTATTVTSPGVGRTVTSTTAPPTTAPGGHGLRRAERCDLWRLRDYKWYLYRWDSIRSRPYDRLERQRCLRAFLESAMSDGALWRLCGSQLYATRSGHRWIGSRTQWNVS